MESKMLAIFLGSAELKKALIVRSTELEIPFKYICAEVGVNYDEFMRSYINSSSNNLEISEDKFSQIMSLLGIGTRVQFVISSTFDYVKVREELKEKYS